MEKNKIKKQKKPVWKPFVKFYTRFPIPWWQYIISAVLGLAVTEIIVRITEFDIAFKTGELYNRVLLGYLLFVMLRTLTSLVLNLFVNYANYKIIFRARKLLWGKMLMYPVSKIEQEQPSNLVSRLINDIAISYTPISSIFSFISSVYFFGRSIIVLVQTNATLTMWLLMVIPVAVIEFWIIGKLQYSIMKKRYATTNTMTRYFAEHIGAAKYIKAQSMDEKETEDGFKAIERRYHADLYSSFMSATAVTINSVYSRMCTLIMAVGGADMINSGLMEPNGIAVFSGYMSNVNQALAEILTQFQSIKGVQGALGKVNELYDAKLEQIERSLNMLEMTSLSFENVSFSYNDGQNIIKDLTVNIPKGKRTVIIGNNGSGKSTLFKLLMRFYTPNEGKMYYNGIDAEEIHLNEWRDSYGYVLQDSPLMSGTIRSNIIYGVKREYTEDEIISAAKTADVYDFITQLPDGFDSEVGLGGMLLSGGQRQRIAIARAIMKNPQILLLDEATANLDVKTDAKIRQALNGLMKDRTTIQIAHDMSVVTTADYIIVLNDGRLESAGTPNEIVKTSETYCNYLKQVSKQEV